MACTWGRQCTAQSQINVMSGGPEHIVDPIFRGSNFTKTCFIRIFFFIDATG